MGQFDVATLIRRFLRLSVPDDISLAVVAPGLLDHVDQNPAQRWFHEQKLCNVVQLSLSRELAAAIALSAVARDDLLVADTDGRLMLAWRVTIERSTGEAALELHGAYMSSSAVHGRTEREKRGVDVTTVARKALSSVLWRTSCSRIVGTPACRVTRVKACEIACGWIGPPFESVNIHTGSSSPMAMCSGVLPVAPRGEDGECGGIEVESAPRVACLAARFVDFVGDRDEPAVDGQSARSEVDVGPSESEEFASPQAGVGDYPERGEETMSGGCSKKGL